MGRIDRIEVHNFKSYKGTQVIGPFKQFTAVVGPNGAGKSNVMDAISFVMGLQARSLRGKEMKDLVYHAKGRAAVTDGAWVKLVYVVDSTEADTLGVEDGDEVTFSRVISPAGATSYKYMGRDVSADQYVARLKDLEILVKARNFLVFQGDVEAIASKSPKQLLQLFEQVSGSEDLKDDYERLEREKEEADNVTVQAVQRRRDLLTERKHAQEVKEENERFQERVREQERLKMQFYLWQLYQLQRSMDAATAQIKTFQAELAKTEAQDESLGKQISAKQKRMADIKLELDTQERKKATAVKAMTAVKRSIVEYQEELNHSKAQAAEAEKSAKAMEKSVAEHLASIANMQQQLKDLEDQLEECSPASGSARATGSARDLERYTTLKQTAAAANASLNAELAQLKRKLESLEEAHKAQQSACDDCTRQRDEFEQDIAGALADMQHTELSIREVQERITKLQSDISALEEQGRREQQRIDTVHMELEQLDNRLRDAKNIRAMNEKEERLEEAFSEMKRLFTGVRGRLIDLCRPTSDKFDLAVRRALGKYCDAVVVDTEAAAFQCVDYLRRQAVGTSMFLPLDKLRVSPPDERWRNLGAQYRYILDVLEYDPSIHNALLSAAGNCVICDTMDAARALKRYRGVKAVTVLGAVISPAGLMTGGNTDQERHRASAAEHKELEAARVRKDQLTKEESELRRGITSSGKSRQLQDLTTDLKSLRGRLPVLQATLDVARQNAEKKQRSVVELNNRIAAMQPELAATAAAVAAAAKDVQRVQAQLDKKTDQVFAEFCAQVGVASIREFEQSTLQSSQALAKTRQALTTKKNQVEQKLEYEQGRGLQAMLDKTRHKAAEERANQKALQTKLTAAQTKEAEASAAVDELDAQVSKLQEAHNSMNEEIKVLRQERAELAKDKNRVNKQINAQEAMLEPLRQRHTDLLVTAKDEDIELPMERGSPDGSEDEPMEAGAIDFTDLEDRAEVEDDAEFHAKKKQFEQQLRDFAAELERMQPNTKADEQYEEAARRVRDSNAELEAAKAVSDAKTAEFNACRDTRLRLFNECFTLVAGNINAVYKDLTSSTLHALGGTASLHLESQDDPFKGGIKFAAMPPMKRYREMEQLSGGEKTVAALALLFAIHSFRPSPFFVMDEVEAALDNVNVNKVSSYIQRRSADAKHPVQCIVMSLKDSFFDKADGLVGVYRNTTELCSQTITLDLNAIAPRDAHADDSGAEDDDDDDDDGDAEHADDVDMDVPMRSRRDEPESDDDSASKSEPELTLSPMASPTASPVRGRPSTGAKSAASKRRDSGAAPAPAPAPAPAARGAAQASRRGGRRGKPAARKQTALEALGIFDDEEDTSREEEPPSSPSEAVPTPPQASRAASGKRKSR